MLYVFSKYIAIGVGWMVAFGLTMTFLYSITYKNYRKNWKWADYYDEIETQVIILGICLPFWPIKVVTQDIPEIINFIRYVIDEKRP